MKHRPGGTIRRLKQPWSLLAYQLGGNNALMALHADGKAEELAAPPATADMAKVLTKVPAKDKLATLVLIDEVLLYAKMRCHTEPGFLDVLVGFFQYLTQAAAKVDGCCVVASLLSSEPEKQEPTHWAERSSPMCTTSSSGSGRRLLFRSKRTT